MVYRGGPKRAALFVRAVAVVAPSLQGGIFDSRGGGLQTAAFDSLHAVALALRCHPESRSPVLGERR